MIYESKEEQERVESVEKRIRDNTCIAINPGSIGKCKLFESDMYKKFFYPETSDISLLTLLYLYSQGDDASQYNRFTFQKLNGEIMDYFVVRCKDTAGFCLEDELNYYESWTN